MLDRIQVWNYKDDDLTFYLWGKPAQYTILDVDGLDPVKATLSASNYANQDGASFQAGRIPPRNIVLNIGLRELGGRSIRALRKELYSFFMPKSEVRLRFRVQEDDGEWFNAYIDGIVESAENSIFSKDPAMTISVMCYDPDFTYYAWQTHYGVTTMAEESSSFVYMGSVETGVTFTTELIDRMYSLVMTVARPGAPTARIAIDYDFLAGDIISIGSERGDKYVEVERNGSKTNLLWATDPTSTWPLFGPGENTVKVKTTGSEAAYQIRYIPRFGGL